MENSNTKQKAIFLILGILGISQALSFFYFTSLIKNSNERYQSPIMVSKSEKDTSQAPTEAMTNNISPEVQSLEGKVLAIEGNTIKLETLSLDAAGNTWSDNRMVKVASDVNITKYKVKDSAVFQAEMEAFKARLEKAGAGFSELMPSELFKMDASLSEIKIGDTIFVNSTENIGTAKEFSASEIFIKPKTQTESSY